MTRVRGVVLDRDGTLVDFHRDEELGAVVSAFHPDQLRFLPGVIDGLRSLASAGYLLALATNQPGAAKGQVSRQAIERTNAALVERLAAEGITLAAVEVCLHHPEGGPGGDRSLVGPCACRKPEAGLLNRLAASLSLDPSRSWMLGDTGVDVEAARRAGFRAGLLVDPHRCERCQASEASSTASAPLSAPRFDALCRLVLAHDGLSGGTSS